MDERQPSSGMPAPSGSGASDPSIRIFPHSIEAERAVLGGLLIEPELLSNVREVISGPDEFYRQAHRTIYEHILAMGQAGVALDLVTLRDSLRATSKLEAVGGFATVSALPDAVVVSTNVVAYARRVHELYVLRTLVEGFRESTEQILRGVPSPEFEGVVSDIERRLMLTCALGSRPRVAVQAGELLEGFFERLERAMELKQPVTGLPTGLADLDRRTAGLQDTDLIIVGARPSMGKTVFALNILHHLSVVHRVPTVIFSLEMGREQLLSRLMCREARVDFERVRTGIVSGKEHERLIDASSRIYGAPLYIDDFPGLDITRLQASLRRMVREKGVRLGVVDYLQLMGGGADNPSREQTISEISRGLKLLAKELRIPLIALSQLNRELEKRKDKRPMMSDLRESGAIEQDADVIMFLYREWVYKHKENPTAYEHDEALKRKAEIIIGKQRNGATGIVNALFFGGFGQFTDAAEEGYEN